MFLRVFFVVSLFVVATENQLAFAQTEDSVAVKKRKFMGFTPLNDTVSSDKKGIFFLPLLYYTPDTRWAFGGAGVYYFKVESKDETQQEARMSYVQFLADYTQNQQLDLWSVWNVFTRDEKFLLKGELRYRNFPDKFYGIGNNTPIESEEKYEYNLISIKNLFMRKIKPGFFAGIDYHFEYEYGFKYTPGGLLENGSITGYRGGIGSAVGLVSVLDTRDNVINAYKGRLCELSSYFYTGALGSSFRFVVVNGQYQQYWQVKKNHVIALQAKARLAFGDVPFLDLSTLGNDDILRGYPKNRFRDKHFAATQVEYRFPLFWRFGLVTFAGLGDVFNHPNEINTASLKYSVGTGLRFVVNPAERLNIRLDYGHGREGGYFYFVVAEAF
jgi:outer membrane protein assembly factor BamA